MPLVLADTASEEGTQEIDGASPFCASESIDLLPACNAPRNPSSNSGKTFRPFHSVTVSSVSRMLEAIHNHCKSLGIPGLGTQDPCRYGPPTCTDRSSKSRNCSNRHYRTPLRLPSLVVPGRQIHTRYSSCRGSQPTPPNVGTRLSCRRYA